MANINIGNAFPLEKLGSDISRNNYNYQSILNGLIEWNKTSNDTVTIRLTKDSDPWYEDYVIPSKLSAFNINNKIKEVTGSVDVGLISLASKMAIVLSGGTKIYKFSSFDASVYNSLSSSEIELLSDSYQFIFGDRIKLTPVGTLPSALNSDLVYFVVYSDAGIIKISTTPYGTPIVLSDGSGIVNMLKLDENLQSDPVDPGDIATIKVSIANSGSTSWEFCYSVLIQLLNASSSYVYGNIVNTGTGLRRVISDCIGSEISLDCNSRPLILSWTSNSYYLVNELVSYNSKLYVVTSYIARSTSNPSLDSSNFKLFISGWNSSTLYPSGSLVYYNSTIYLSTSSVTGVSPTVDTDSWEENVVLPVLNIGSFSKSSLFRWYVTRDVSAIYLKNTGDTASNSETHIDYEVNVKVKEPSSIYQKSVGVFRTSNYSSWPMESTPIWSETVEATDTSIAINKRQKYSAVMMFDHANMATSKTVNFINYDGPDLDQGLCIYLPSESDIGETGLAYPEDGFTYEFFFRIWPTPSYTGAITRDNIVNKSQIYVYSALNRESVITDSCEMPIAKFSMARTSNYYIFAENISIPDKPVCYRATFVYSASERRWITMDYYQLPDHIFVGPVGFIDPQSPSNLDINSSVGTNNPNPAFVGYETAGFPLFQDPFSNGDLTPYRLITESDLDKFYNRTL